jgi:ATP-dependent DNA ligase
MLDELFRKVESQFNVRPSTRKPSAPRGVAMLAKTYCGELPAFYAVEPKVDGVRVIVTADLDNGLVSFASRRGNRLASLDHLADQVLGLFGSLRGIWTLDCEAVAGKGFFNDVGEIRSETPALDARLWVFDVPCMSSSSYCERRKVLVDIFDAALPKPDSLFLVPSLVGVLPEEAFRDFTAQGFEGVMVKDASAPYSHGVRSAAWQKLKASDTVDAEVVDVVEGEGKCAGMAGRIVVRLGRRYVNVGTGMSNETRRDLLARRAQVIGQTAEVAFHCVTPDASLRHPSLVRIRGDK